MDLWRLLMGTYKGTRIFGASPGSAREALFGFSPQPVQERLPVPTVPRGTPPGDRARQPATTAALGSRPTNSNCSLAASNGRIPRPARIADPLEGAKLM